MGAKNSKRRMLPEPTGPYSVGCADLMTEYGADGLFIRLYYPTDKVDLESHQHQLCKWVDRKEYVHGFARFVRINPSHFKVVWNLKVGNMHMPALWHAPISTKQTEYPLMVFSPGLAGMRCTYSVFCCEMASQGFIVAAVEHRDKSSVWTYHLKSSPSTEDAKNFQSKNDKNKTKINQDKSNKKVHSKNDNKSSESADNQTKTTGEKQSSSSSSLRRKLSFRKSGRKQHKKDNKAETNANEMEINNNEVGEVDLEDLFEEIPLKMDVSDLPPVDFKFRNRQLSKRVFETTRALHLLEEINIGLAVDSKSGVKNGPDKAADSTKKATSIVLGADMNWSQFKGKFDLNKACIAGHSFGGATVIGSLAANSEWCAGVLLDAWMFPVHPESYSQVSQPILFLNMDKFQWKLNVQMMQKFWRDDSEAERQMVTIREAVHHSPTDFTFVLNGLLAKKFGSRGKICHRLCMQINNNLSLAFLRQHLDLVSSESESYDDVFNRYREDLIDGTNLDMNLEDDPGAVMKNEEKNEYLTGAEDVSFTVTSTRLLTTS